MYTYLGLNKTLVNLDNCLHENDILINNRGVLLRDMTEISQLKKKRDLEV